MMKLRNIKIGTKIVGMVLLSLIFSSAISLFVLNRLKATDTSYSNLINGQVTAAIGVQQVVVDFFWSLLGTEQSTSDGGKR